jgi:hypothetical protein
VDTRRPWWPWVASASFVAYFVFLNLSLYFAREPMGFSYVTRPSGVYATVVTPGYPAARAGFAAGDRIVSGMSLPISDAYDMNVVNANVPPGTTTAWELERAGARTTVTVEPLARVWVVPRFVFAVLISTCTLSLALGLLVVWRGPQDASTRLGAWMLGSLGCVYLPLFPRSMMSLWRELPAPIEAMLWPAAVSSMAIHVLLFAFCARVPRPLLSPRQLALALVPGLGITAYVTVFVSLAAYAPARALNVPMPEWLVFAGPLIYPAYFFATALVLVKSVRTAVDPTDRRRAQTLLAGVACEALGLLPFAVALGLQQSGRMAVTTSFLLVAAPLFCVLPLSFAYAMLRHRLFDLRVIVRLGLQYALARGLVLAVVPLAVAALVADVLLHGDQSLRSVLAERGWTYGVIAAATLFAYSQRERWMIALDRRFFRERYAAQQILREVVEDIGRAPDLETAARKVVSRVESALHPTIVAVMRKPRSTGTFVLASAVPDGSTLLPLAATNAISKIVRALGRPVVFGTQFRRDLPDSDNAWLHSSDVELVVPILTDDQKDEALLVLGPRRSEEPYAQEDLDLLGAIAASLALLAGRSSPPTSSSDQPTTSEMSPRRLGNRYRLEVLIGEGGMGVVYAAIDETLGRSVAVKLVREELLRGPEGLERFQREARAAASLSHPHIVTVHDFGVDDGAPYLVMERLFGRSLRNALTVDGRIAPDRTLAILRGVAMAMEAAHGRGMVHRDLKPENVFLAGESGAEIAKVLDFGIAKSTSSTSATTAFATSTGVVAGTVPYMSPEQLAGGAPAPGWDVWSLAVIAYEMLGGVHPFSAAAGGSGLPISRPPAIRSFAPDLPIEAEAFFDCALSLDPARRPATASVLVTDLQAAIQPHR